MNKELELQLVERYPDILRDYGGDNHQTLMSFGFECGDGWYNLLDECMAKISHFCYLSTTKSGDKITVVARQIKQKFGSLRFYVDIDGASETEESIIHDIIAAAERKSAQICEETGDYGVMCRRGGWYKTLSRKAAFTSGYIACDENQQKYWDEENQKEGLTK